MYKKCQFKQFKYKEYQCKKLKSIRILILIFTPNSDL